MGDKHFTKEAVKVTICYNGKEKKIPLVVQPSPNLSDVQVQLALESVTRLVQQIFRIADSRNFTLRDSYSYSKLTKNSFKQQNFPLRWNVVFDKKEASDSMLKHGGVLFPMATTAGLYTGHSAEMLSRTSYPSRHHTLSHEVLGQTHSDPFGSARVMFPVDMGKNVFVRSENGSYGFLLRHFSIRESHEPSQENEQLRATSPDSERMSTVFVYKLQPNGPAQLASLNEGDKVYSINGHSVTRCSLEQVQQLLHMSNQEVVLQVSPKSDDVLQLFRYAPFAYGPSGEHMTKLGRAWVYDVNTSQCFDWLKDDTVTSDPHSRSSPHDHVATPSAGSSGSHDNMVTPPVSRLSSSESSSRYASPMADSPVIGGSHSSSGSRLMDDVYITGSLSQIPISPTTSLNEWALDREDSQSPIPSIAHIKGRSSASPLHFSQMTRTRSPHLSCVATTHQRSPDPDLLPCNNSSDDVIGLEASDSSQLHILDTKSSSYTILDHKPYERPLSTSMKTALQHRAASSPSLDLVGDYHGEVFQQHPQQVNSTSCNHDISGRATASGRRGIKLSLEDLTRIEPSRDVKKRSREETFPSNDMLAEKQTLSPIEDGLAHSQELSFSSNATSETTSQRSNKRSYSSQRERLHRSLSKPLTGASQSSQGSYSLEYGFSSDHISGKSPPVTTDTSQLDYVDMGSQDFTRQRTNSFKKYLETSLHEAFPSLDDDDEEEPAALEVKTVQQSQDEHVNHYGMAISKLPPGHDHVVNQLSRETTTKGYSPGTSPMRPHRIIMHDNNYGSSQPYYMEHSKSHTIERVFSDGSYRDKRQKSSGSIFANKPKLTGKQQSIDDQLMFLRQSKPVLSVTLQQACCHGILYRKLEKESGRRAHDRSWKCFYAMLKDNHLFFYKDRIDIDLNKIPDDTPVDVTSALADIAHSYTKRKFVFRLTTQSGVEMLLQAEDQTSLMCWVKAIQKCNEEGMMQKGGRDARTALIIKKKDKQMKGPSSPPPVRKVSMPSPTAIRKKNVSTGKVPGEGGTRLPLFELIKNSLRLHRSHNSSSDEPDFSSYMTFGVDLDQCPASIENKLVPLVVEFCIHHIEEHGLDIEGLYRVPGTRVVVNKLISELNKGNYNHDFNSEQFGDIHNYTSLLKAFFNELVDPIVPSDMYHQFVAAAKEHDFNRLYTIKQLVYRLPPGNKHTLKFLLTHLRTVHEHCDSNKMNMKNLCIVFGPTLMRCPVHEVGPSYIILELFLKNMDSFFEDVHLTWDPSEMTDSGGKLLPKQQNADKQLNVDQGFRRVLSPRPNVNYSDVKVVSSEANSAVGSIWKKNSPRNPQIHKTSTTEAIDDAILEGGRVDDAIPEGGRVVNIDEAIANRNSMHHDDNNIYQRDVAIHRSNGKLDRHGDSNRNHRLMGDVILLDHNLGVAVDSSSSSLGNTSSDEHVFRNYFDNSWEQLRQQKLSQHEVTMDTLDINNETRAQSVTSSYSTHLESDL